MIEVHRGADDLRMLIRSGRGIAYPLEVRQRKTFKEALDAIGTWLKPLPAVETPTWSPRGGYTTQRSCWAVYRLDGSGWLTDATDLTRYQGDRRTGMYGIELVTSELGAEWGTISTIQGLLWDWLTNASVCVGLPHDLMTRSVLRFTFALDDGERAGVGMNLNGGLLTATLSSTMGLFALGYDGMITIPSEHAVVITPGVTAHDLTADLPPSRRILPTFTLVPEEVAMDGVTRVSVTASLELPDRQVIPSGTLGSRQDWFHDQGRIRAEMGPQGPLRYLWEAQAEALGISVEDLVAGVLPD